MSVQKLGNKKKIPYNESYSKNPIINSLIKQKLQSEMTTVKQNFTKIINKSSQLPINNNVKQQLSHNLIKKHHRSTSLSSKQIKESLKYDVLSKQQNYTINFIKNRQLQSPLISKEILQPLHQARFHGKLLQTKMLKADQHRYQNYGQIIDENQKVQRNMDFYIKLSESMRNQIGDKQWTPIQGQIQSINEHQQSKKMRKFDKISQQNEQSFKGLKSQKLNLAFQPNISSHDVENLKPIKQRLVKKILVQIPYEPKKYHKGDYRSLQRWFESSILFLNEHQNQMSISNHLNRIYGIYICTWKQFIRLTYIQFAEKGLLLQKLLWSWVRLSNKLIETQHQINYQQYKINIKQIKQMRKLYENRIEQLESKMKKMESNLKNTENINQKLMLAYVSYAKVNTMFMEELERSQKQVKELDSENKYLKLQFNKMVNQLEESGHLKTTTQNDRTTYFLVNQEYKPQIIAQINNKDKTVEKAKQYEYNRYGQKITRIESLLNKFWMRKEDDMELRCIVQAEIMNKLTQDFGVMSTNHGPNETADYGMVFPDQQQEQQDFSKFLQKQFNEQKNKWDNKQQEYNTLYLSLKELYQQSYDKVTKLSEENKNLRRQIKLRLEKNNSLNKDNQSKDQEIQTLRKVIKIQEQQIMEKDKQLKSLLQKMEKIQKKLNNQKQNAQILVMNNLQSKKKIKQIENKFIELLHKIHNVAPYLQKLMQIAENEKDQILLQISAKIQQYLSEYVIKDTNIFLTK